MQKPGQSVLALAIPLSRFKPGAGGGSAFFLRRNLSKHMTTEGDARIGGSAAAANRAIGAMFFCLFGGGWLAFGLLGGYGMKLVPLLVIVAGTLLLFFAALGQFSSESSCPCCGCGGRFSREQKNWAYFQRRECDPVDFGVRRCPGAVATRAQGSGSFPQLSLSWAFTFSRWRSLLRFHVTMPPAQR